MQSSMQLLSRLRPPATNWFTSPATTGTRLHFARNSLLPWQQCCRASNVTKQSRQAKRLEKFGMGIDGKPLPIPNYKRVFPRMYKVLVVNQDGSTYTINHRHPYRIMTLPLDLNTLSPEELEAREKARLAARSRVYVEEEGLEEDEWDEDRYKDL